MEVNTITELLGHTLTSIEVNDSRDQLSMTREDGKVVRFYHRQDCCESVEIDDIIGDLQDLVGSPITLAEEVIEPEGADRKERWDESFTWTFYKFATVKGYVDVRWYGASNGYYSEQVDMAIF